MQGISVFDMLKIGVGPSSSHTLGPWRAAQRFLSELPPALRSSVSRVHVDLYGSLAKTGKGHGTAIAVQLGLRGEDPETIDVAMIAGLIRDIARTKRIRLAGGREVPFEPDLDIEFHHDQQLPLHPNALRFTAGSSGPRNIRLCSIRWAEALLRVNMKLKSCPNRMRAIRSERQPTCLITAGQTPVASPIS